MSPRKQLKATEVVYKIGKKKQGKQENRGEENVEENRMENDDNNRVKPLDH